MLWCSVLKWSGIAQRLYEAAAILFKVWLHTIKEENKTFELDIDKHVHHTHAYTKDTLNAVFSNSIAKQRVGFDKIKQDRQ